ncbi:unnamed protein product [Parascedosporium putredinis]|uniref:Aquaporin-like protein n=1 Tax=Parascedosporium putredinis TaxID=1442378 RepID=A0A9P1H0V6_9PEZI|nr:unnamed protein product [Parascedosporium putredinis]CAI7993058.1 unnamed protein product [Parascedosporium putredinis]
MELQVHPPPPHFLPYTSGATTPRLQHAMEHDISTGLHRYLDRIEVPYRPVSHRRLELESRRPRLLRQCLAEFTGVCFFVFPALASVATYILHADSELGVSAFGSHFQTGCAFAVGVAAAIITCAPTSGGHFNPAITLAMAFWQDFPGGRHPCTSSAKSPAPSSPACSSSASSGPRSASSTSPSSPPASPRRRRRPASILCSFPDAHGQANIAYLFMIEFFADAFIGIAIWAALDPANPFVKPAGIPFVIGAAYAVIIWGSAAWASAPTWPGTSVPVSYAPIAILVNIPATLLATAFYEFVLRDSMAIISQGHTTCKDGSAALYRHLHKLGLVDEEHAVVIDSTGMKHAL